MNQEITRVNQRLEATATSITDTIIPQHEKIIELKKHMATLYQQLGCTEQQSWYKTLLESSEFNHIEPFVTAMVKQEQVMVDAMDQRSEPSEKPVEKTKGSRGGKTPQKAKKGGKKSQSKQHQ